MKNRPSRLGLVAEGNTTQSSILRLDKLAEDLGPVKSTAMSTARRLTNALQGGYPVNDFRDLAGAELVLIRVPDAALPRIISEILKSGLVLNDLPFLLCESWQSIEAMAPLRDKGALVATIICLPLDRKDWFVVDGDSRAVRLTKRLMEANRCRVTELDEHGKHFLFASELLVNTLPVPLFVAAQQSLREAGFTGNLLTTVLEQMLVRTVRDLMRGGKGRWGGPLLECSEEVSDLHLAGVNARRPELGEFVHENLGVARKMMETRR